MNNYISINLGVIDSSNEDLWDCLKPYSANVLILDTYDKFYVQISEDSSTLQKFESMEEVFDFYADFIISNELLYYSKPFLTGLMQSTYDEDIDAMYDFLESEGGDVQFILNGDFDFSGQSLEPIISSISDAPFCMIQSNKIDVKINGQLIMFEDKAIDLNEIFSCIDNFESKSGIYIN
jgi:hypothetical protein